METLLIQHGDVLHAGRIEQSADLRIEGRKIAEIGRGLEPAPGSSVIDATGLYVLPGLIDIHKYSRYQAENGVTACVATLAFAGFDTYNRIHVRKA
jgi:dihydroorotase-like cyclic amidohydrolase